MCFCGASWENNKGKVWQSVSGNCLSCSSHLLWWGQTGRLQKRREGWMGPLRGGLSEGVAGWRIWHEFYMKLSIGNSITAFSPAPPGKPLASTMVISLHCKNDTTSHGGNLCFCITWTHQNNLSNFNFFITLMKFNFIFWSMWFLHNVNSV